MQKNVLLNFEQMTSEQASQPAHLMLVRIEMSRTAATAQKGADRCNDTWALAGHEARTLHTCSRNTTISKFAPKCDPACLERTLLLVRDYCAVAAVLLISMRTSIRWAG